MTFGALGWATWRKPSRMGSVLERDHGLRSHAQRAWKGGFVGVVGVG